MHPPLGLERFRDYADLRAGFRWQIPARYNIAAATVDRWAAKAPARIALIQEDEAGRQATFDFRSLQHAANRFANVLTALGVKRGDRVALVLPQGLETGVAHLGIYKIAAIAVPLSYLYGPDTLEYILNNCRAAVLVIAAEYHQRVAEIRGRLPHLRHVVRVGGEGPDPSWDALLSQASGEAQTAVTEAEDPAMVLYTSGTTGPPKGVLHAHRVVAGYLPTFSLFFNNRFDDQSLFWTPSDWAWGGGLLDILLPGWAFGRPILASRARFEPERTLAMIARHGATHAFLAPTALKMLAQVDQPKERFGTKLKVIASGGEAVAAEVLRWSREELRSELNEFYGLTEVNHLIGNCSALWAPRPGFMGLPYPGRDVALIDDAGEAIGNGMEGQVAVRRGDPTCFLGYWENPQKTEAMMLGSWVKTGDLAVREDDGYYRFVGRNDDLIKSAGYRIGPTEVEEVLLSLAEVAEAAVIPRPDSIRGSIVKALVRLSPGVAPSDALKARIQEHVKSRLAAFKYPRELEFVEDFPLTTTGKIDRKLLRKREREAVERQSGTVHG